MARAGVVGRQAPLPSPGEWRQGGAMDWQSPNRPNTASDRGTVTTQALMRPVTVPFVGSSTEGVLATKALE